MLNGALNRQLTKVTEDLATLQRMHRKLRRDYQRDLTISNLTLDLLLDELKPKPSRFRFNLGASPCRAR
jgi:hypothetical protein